MRALAAARVHEVVGAGLVPARLRVGSQAGLGSRAGTSPAPTSLFDCLDKNKIAVILCVQYDSRSP